MGFNSYEYYERMERLCNDAWNKLAGFFWYRLPDNLSDLFYFAYDNPVAKNITHCLIGMAAFYLLLRLVRTFLRRW